jgi:deazaflavin-dependent oxidoreductase (nitroreductase family)
MPLPRSLARFNLKVTNPILGKMAWWMPGFAVLTHVGRRTGTPHRSPVNLFRHGDEFGFASSYAGVALWVRQVLAAGLFIVLTRGHDIELVDPRLVHDPARTLVPAPVRAVLGAVAVDDFVVMRRS